MIRDAILVSAIFSAGVFGFINRDAIYEYAGVNPQDIADARAQRKNKQIPTTPKPRTDMSALHAQGNFAAIAKSKDGQFWTQAHVNSTDIRFLVDTGASVVVLTPDDARKAGLRPDELTYDAQMNTAAGMVMAARIDIANVSVGDVTVYNVRAVVIRDGLTQSLLGMSFLGEISKMEITSDELILRQ